MQSVASLSVRNQRQSATISEIEDTSSIAASSLYRNNQQQQWGNLREVASTHKYQRSRQADSSAKVGPCQSQRNTSPENFTEGLQEDILFEKIQSVLPSQVPSLRTKYM